MTLLDDIIDALTMTRQLIDAGHRDAALHRRVYLGIYAGRGATAAMAAAGRDDQSLGVDTHFARSIQEAVRDKAVLGPARVVACDGATATLEIDDVLVSAPMDRVVAEEIAAGSTVGVYVPAVVPGVLPGFIVRQGKTPPQEPLSRIYLAIGPEQAVWVLGTMAHAFDDAGLGFSMKTLAHPSAYFRTDAAVVYVSTSTIDEALALTRDLVQADRVALGPHTPLLTSKIVAGVGMADDPTDVPLKAGRRPSHGEWVSQLLIDAALDQPSISQACDHIRESIGAIGRDPDRPHLRSPLSSRSPDE